MAKSKSESILIDRSLLDIEVADSSNPSSTVRPELVVFTHEPTGIVIDMSLNFDSEPITGKEMDAMLRRIKRKLKSKTGRANKSPLIESWYRKIAIDHQNKR